MTDEVGRQKKVYSDALGRQWKAEALNWDLSVYSTSVSVFNARDQVTRVKQYAGVAPGGASSTDEAASCPSGTCQETILAYDGYGRLSSKHVPEQNAGAATVYAYNNDDTIQSVTDARGSYATYSYNSRHLVTGIVYTPSSGVTPTATVGYGYDAAGNRTSMTDGFGSKTYSYNQLSQMMSETRTFADPSPPYLNASFTLSYDYNLGGQLKKITDPTNTTINYGFDLSGRLNAVTGSDSLYAGVSDYASNFQYRASGATKHLDYGNSLKLDLSYNNRLQASEYDLKTSAGSFVMGQQYQYYGDGRISASTDLTNSNLNRGYGYDQAGRLASGNTANGSLYGPYSQTYNYDAWDNMNSRSWRTFYYNQYCHCMVPTTNYSSSTYTNNRNTTTGWNYDADGRLIGSSDNGVNSVTTFDGAGELIASTRPGRTTSQGLDGDGHRVKWVENNVTTYHLRSSALGGYTIVELDQYGNKLRGYVYDGGEEIAKQESGQVLWGQRDVSGASMRLTNSTGAVTSRIETDPLETQVSDSSAYNYNGGGSGYGLNPNGFYGDPTMPNMGCRQDGFEADCNKVMRDLSEGIAVQCPNNNCSPISANGQWYSYRYTDNGAGWMSNNQFFGVPRTRPSLSGPNRSRPFADIEFPLHSPRYLPFNIAPKKTLCDYLESKLWDLFKSHDNEVGREFPGDKRGKSLTDCYVYAQNVLTSAYDKIGRKDIADRIRAGFKDARGNPEFAAGLAGYLVSLGWRTHYWNPDVRNPSDGQSEHPASYQQATRTGNYAGIHVDDFIINYHKTNPASANDMTAFNEFSKVRFAFGLARGGTHNFLYSYGMTFEVHWDKEGENLYERKSFYNFNWLSGLMLTPPCK
jgi:YD repeat-containing protein